jgi:hypothetical protein
MEGAGSLRMELTQQDYLKTPHGCLLAPSILEGRALDVVVKHVVHQAARGSRDQGAA